MGVQATPQDRIRENDLALAAARVDMIADEVQRLRDRYGWVLTPAHDEALSSAVRELRSVVAGLFETVRP